ncbi:MAG: DUF4388 domain-containing protein [Bradymonadia bacterium]
MALQGTLADFGIAEILQLIGTQQKTGVLHVEQEGTEGSIKVLFLGGKIVRCLVTHSERKDLLGNRLVAAEVVPSRDMQRCLGLQRKQPEDERQLIGELLLEQGLIDRGTLDEFIMLQMREHLYGLFEYKDGRYRFESRPPSFAEAGPGMLPAESVLMEGFRMLDEWPLIRNRIESHDMVFKTIKALEDEEGDAEALERVLDDAFSEFLDEPVNETSGSLKAFAGVQLGPGERRLYPLIDGKRSVHRLVELSRLGEFETCKALVTLLNEGYVEVVEAPAPSAIPQAKQRTSGDKNFFTGLALLALVGVVLATSVVLKPTPEEGDTVALQAAFERRARRNRVHLIESALEVYAAEQGDYPTRLEQLIEAGILEPDALSVPGGAPLSYISIGTDYDLR